MHLAKRALRSLLSHAGNSSALWPLLRTRATIFMLHRFRMPDAGVEGHDPQALRRALAALRRDGYELVPLDGVLSDLLEGRTRARPTVAFTIDDGYLDQAEVGAPAFAEYDCPVTTFVTSGFLDGQLWFWWDRIEYVFEHTARSRIELTIGDGSLSYAWTGEAERRAAQADFTARCKEVPDAVKHEGIARLAAAAEVDLPAQPPRRYAPMTWEGLRACERMTMTFGPHTVTHPVLARTTDEQSRFELTESWRRLSAEAARPVPVFCYPNGRLVDFGEREIATLRAIGIRGAVTGQVGYADSARVRSAANEPFRVRRFGYPENPAELLLIANGVERLKQIVRRES